MDFYRDISDYYDYIFPFKEVTYNFLLESFKLSNVSESAKILDIACGSGSYAINLATSGTKVLATDLDPQMINKANNKNYKDNVTFKVFNMLDLSQLNNGDKGFDFIYCIGNSIVHLDNIIEINSVIKDVYELLNEGGIFVIQVINFDRILQDNVKALPTIYNEEEGVTFRRNYIHFEDEHKIEFSTILDIETERITEQYTQSVKLYPLQVNEVFNGFEEAGFSEIELFGGFNGSNYHKESSYQLVVRGRKSN